MHTMINTTEALDFKKIHTTGYDVLSYCSVSNQLLADINYWPTRHLLLPGRIRVKTRKLVILRYLVLLYVVLLAV